MPYRKNRADYIVKPDKYKRKKPKSRNPWSRNYDDSPDEETSYFSQPQDYSQGYVNPYVVTPEKPVFERSSDAENEANLRKLMEENNKPLNLQNRWKQQPSRLDFSQLSDREKCCCEPQEEEYEIDYDNIGKVPYRYGKAFHEENPVAYKNRPIWENVVRQQIETNPALYSPFKLSASNGIPRVEDVLSNYSVTFDKIMTEMANEGRNQKMVINSIESPISCEYGFICGENFGEGGEYKSIENNGAVKLGKQSIYPPNFIKGLPALIDYIAMKGDTGQKEGSYTVDLVNPMKYLLTKQNACIYLMFHTHPGDVSAFSGADILVPNLLVEDIRHLGDKRFYSILENTINMRFAVVVEDLDKYEKWSNGHLKTTCKDIYLDVNDGKSKEREISYLSRLVLDFNNYFENKLQIGFDSREGDLYYSEQIRAEAKKNNELNQTKNAITRYGYAIVTAITTDATDTSPEGRVVNSGLGLYVLVKKETQRHIWKKIEYPEVLKALKAVGITEKDFKQQKIRIMQAALATRK